MSDKHPQPNDNAAKKPQIKQQNTTRNHASHGTTVPGELSLNADSNFPCCSHNDSHNQNELHTSALHPYEKPAPQCDTSQCSSSISSTKHKGHAYETVLSVVQFVDPLTGKCCSTPKIIKTNKEVGKINLDSDIEVEHQRDTNEKDAAEK